MADRNWRKSPSIQEARRVAQSLGKTAVIMVMVDEVEGTLELATYGTTGARCRAAETLGEAAYAAVMESL